MIDEYQHPPRFKFMVDLPFTDRDRDSVKAMLARYVDDSKGVSIVGEWNDDRREVVVRFNMGKDKQESST